MKKQQNVLNILKNKTATKVVMDAFITQSDIDLIKREGGSSSINSQFYVINNTYKPFEGEGSVNIYEYWQTNNYLMDVGRHINALLSDNKRVIISITSKKAADQLYNDILKCDKDKIGYYHGDNYQIEESGLTHAKRKQEDFINIESKWNSYQVVLYTQSISCGVDYNVEIDKTFDQFVHIYAGGSCTPDVFVQSIL